MTRIRVKTCLFGLIFLIIVFTAVVVFAEPTETSDATSELAASNLVKALAGDDAVARFTAEEQLTAMRSAAVPILQPLATSSGFTIARQYALHILARIDTQPSIDLLLSILEQEPNIEARALICRHLGQLGVEQAVPIIGKWLFTIRDKPLMDWDGPYVPHILTPAYGWFVHVHTLREIGSEKGMPILEEMMKTKHDGNAGKALMKAYRTNLNELRQEAAFWEAVRSVDGLEPHVKSLFRFFRRDTLARIRLYRDKVLRLGLEERWVLEGMQTHSDKQLREAAAKLLAVYDAIGVASRTTLSSVDEQ